MTIGASPRAVQVRNHLTPGLAEVSASGCGLQPVPVEFFRLLGLRIPFVNTEYGVRPSMPRRRWGRFRL